MQHGMLSMLKSRRAADLLQLMDPLTFIKLYTGDFGFSPAELYLDR